MINITIIGEKSIPGIGMIRLIGFITGSVMSDKNLTIGLYGSGLNQDMTARTMITISYTFKTATRKRSNTDI